MDIGPILKSPYLETITTPARWIGKAVSTVLTPYTKAYEYAQQNRVHPNPVMNYLSAAFNETGNDYGMASGMMIALPGAVGGFGGLIAGLGATKLLLAGAALPLKILGGLAVTSAVTAVSAAVAPVVFAAGLAGVSLVAATAVLGLPGVVTGISRTVGHVFGGDKKPAQQVSVIKVPASSLTSSANSAFASGPEPEEIAEYIDALPGAEKKRVFERLRELSLDDFGEAAELQRPVASAKTASFTRKAKPSVAVTP